MTNPQLDFNEILTEMKKYNPHASAQDISVGIISIIEREILPNAIRYMNVPDLPSWIDMSIRKSGRKQKKKFKPTESLEKRRRTIQQIEYVKQKLYWDGGTISMPTYIFPDADFITRPPERDLSSTLKRVQPKEKLVKHFGQINDTSGQKTSIPIDKFQIKLQKEIQEKIISDVFFENVFRRLETSVRELVETRNLEGNIEVIFRTDHEISSWKKYVILINLPPKLSFNEKTKLWTIFDITIRNKLKELIDKADGEEKEYLSNFNKKMFVHIEL